MSTAKLETQLNRAAASVIKNFNYGRFRRRWQTAIERAVVELSENDLLVWNGSVLQICSRRSRNLYRAETNFCECPAYHAGFPCYHRAAAKILVEYDKLRSS